jgi:glycerate dehydrogenase
MEPLIVNLDRETLGVDLRRPGFPHRYVEHEVTETAQVAERLAGATVAITNKVRITAEAIAALPDLRLIAVAATGTDIIDKAAARQAGIVISNIRGYAVNTVPEHVIALMFALRRKLVEYAHDVREGVWQRSRQFCFLTHPIHDIAGTTMGIVGFGALGKSIARRAEALDMRVLACDAIEQPGLVDFETVLTQSDVITLHAPLTPETRNMIGAAEFGRMKPGAILINTARGGLVDEAALADALRSGKLAGAGFDVLTDEPPRQGNVLLDPSIPNLIVTPHVAWASLEAQRALAEQLTENIEAWHAGRTRNIVE